MNPNSQEIITDVILRLRANVELIIGLANVLNQQVVITSIREDMEWLNAFGVELLEERSITLARQLAAVNPGA